MLACLLPVGIAVSLIAGIKLCRMDAPLARLAGWLTLKPIAATPLWAILLNLSLAHRSWWSVALTALPGIGLTALLLIWYRFDLSRENLPQLALLLLADTLRWGSTFLFLVIGYLVGANGNSNPLDAITSALFDLSMTMPLIFAIVAWRVAASMPSPGQLSHVPSVPERTGS